jgi:pimeloyl-ACP methyl ester carboxylesterase
MVPQLTVTKDGDGIAKVAVLSGGPGPNWGFPVTFLIHGYNVDQKAASAAFRQLVDLIREKAGMPPLLEEGRCLLYWPAYVSGGLWLGKLPVLSAASYAWQVPSARDAARALKAFIDEQTHSRPRLNLIAHSLGCRLVLELLQHYSEVPYAARPVFDTVVLMAAAVPTHFLDWYGRLGSGTYVAERVVVLFSEKDEVLRNWFPPGQTLAREGFLPEAVGRRGRPVFRWADVQATENDHSDYFRDENTARAIAEALKRTVPIRLAERRPATAPKAGLQRTLPQLSLPSRQPDSAVTTNRMLG